MKKFVLVFFLYTISLSADDDVLLFKPYTSAVFEPRIGSIINLTDDKLRLDIGASFDLYRSRLDDITELRIGGDFFTYTRLRSENNFKFPVETSDYYFGINSAIKFQAFEQDFGSRLRIAHISSHLVDGFSKNGTFSKMPFVYSREFVDFSLAYYGKSKHLPFRIYGGGVYVFSTTPGNLNELIPYIGLDFTKKIINHFELSGGLDIRKGESNLTNVAAQLGVNMKFFKNFGIFVGYYKYSGSSMHGMFFDNFDNFNGVGFQIIYF
jgi:hypothetical protein